MRGDLRAVRRDTVISLEELPPDAERWSDRIAADHRALPMAGRRGRRRDRRLRVRQAPPRARRLPLVGRRDRVPVAGAPSAAGSAAPCTRRCSSLLVRQGVYVACAGVTLPNEPASGCTSRWGSLPVGVYQATSAWKFGAWHDVGWWQLPAARAERRRARASSVRRRAWPADRCWIPSGQIWPDIFSTWSRSDPPLPLEHQQRQRRAGVRGHPRQPHQLRRHPRVVDDRIAPVVEPDQLGQQFDAQPVGVAARSG